MNENAKNIGKAVYNHNGCFKIIKDEQLKKELETLEVKLRSGKIQYTEEIAFQSQVNDIKKSWDEESKLFIRNKARTLANGSNITPNIIFSAMQETCKEHIAVKRAEKRNSIPYNEYAYMTADIALSTILRIAPDCSIESLPRKINSKTIRIKTATNPRRLVINEDIVNEADIYIQAIFIKAFSKSILLGWATKEDVKAATKANKDTENGCYWSKMAYYIPIEKLRPMSSLLELFEVDEIPNGLIFETMPKISEIPIIAANDIQERMLNPTPPKEFTEDDFLRSCGIEVAKKNS